jgi:tetratricopeptide (TPR) repeat protein
MCAQCGETLRREWRFCPECGTGVDAEEPEEDVEAVTGLTADRPRQSESRVVGGARPAERSAGAGSDAAALSERGAAAYEAEQYGEAIRLFRQAIETDPGNVAFHINLAVALGEDGQTEDALATYRRALELDPRATGAYLNMGYLFSERERYDEAREAWEQVIRIDPRSPEAKEARESLQHLDEL